MGESRGIGAMIGEPRGMRAIIGEPVTACWSEETDSLAVLYGEFNTYRVAMVKLKFQ